MPPAAAGGRGLRYEYRCYRRTAGLLLVLNIPMGGVVVLMVRENASYSYPGYVIYLSALYTAYAAVLAVVNLSRTRRLGSPILSAARILHLISVMMSVLGLQTAMLARFSFRGEAYRKLMNTITGSFVCGATASLALFMLLRAWAAGRKLRAYEKT